MKRKPHGTQRSRHINWIGDEGASTAQYCDSPAQPFVQRFLNASASLFPCRPSYLGSVTDGAVRMAPLLGLPRFLADHGLNPDAEIRAMGCDPTLFRDPDNTIDFAAVGKLLTHAATVTGCSCPGLQLGIHQGLGATGVVGESARLAPDLGTALRILILYFHLHDRGAVPFLWDGEHQAMFGYTLHCPDVPGTDHIYDGALAIAHNIISELAGKGWNATEVRLFREKPTDISPYRHHFQAPLRFGAEQAAIIFPASDLLRPLAGTNTRAYARALRDLHDMDAVFNGELSDRVRRLLRRLFVTGSNPGGINLDEVAQFFLLHPRTFNRRLRAEGTTFRTLLTEIRHEVARQLLRDTHLQIAEIALALGYADAASFNHAFRDWSGTSATIWRSLHRSGSENG